MAKEFISYGQNVRRYISAYSRDVIIDLLRKAGGDWCLITSTSRTPEEQAKAMFDNCEKRGADSQKKLYGPYGDQVIDVYIACQEMGMGANQTIEAMARKIRLVGPGKVSHHCADGTELDVIDIAPSSFKSKAIQLAFEAAVKDDVRVTKFFSPTNNDPAEHLEIPQPPTT